MVDESKLLLTIDGKQAERSTDKLNAKFRKLDRSGDRVERKFRKLQGETNRLGSKFQSLSSVAGIFKAALAGIVATKIISFTKNAISQFAEFDSVMKGVEAITGATTAQMDALSRKAQELGRTTKFSAQQAASAIEILAKNGLTYSQIMTGAVDSTLVLAAATGTDLATAADIATDAMLQFGFKASELETVIDGITGVTTTSKFGINDYAGALAQAGGAAAGLGVEFNDMNAVISATSSLFKSGSDAGTAFKTFILRLGNTTKEAKELMDEYGFSAFNASGELKSMQEVADNLNSSFGNLSEQDLADKLGKIFGTDAVRTAIGLMDQADGKLQDVKDRIDEVSAAAQAETRQGSLGALFTQLGSAASGFAIAVGDRLAPAVSKIIVPLTNFINLLSKLVEIDPKDVQLEQLIQEETKNLKFAQKQVETYQKLIETSFNPQAIAEYKKMQEAWNDAVDNSTKVINDATQAWGKFKREQKPTIVITESAGVAIDNLSDSAGTAAGNMELLSKGTNNVAKGEKDLTNETDKLNKQIEKQNAEFDELLSQVDDAAEKQFQLKMIEKERIAELVRLTGATRDVSEETLKLNKALDDGEINFDLYADAIFNASDGSIELADSTEQTTKEIFNLSEALVQVQSNIQSGFSDLFVDLFSGKGIESFKDFAKRVLDIFKKLLADMAAAWITSKIFKTGASFDFGSIFSGGGSSASVKDMGSSVVKGITTAISKSTSIGKSIATGITKAFGKIKGFFSGGGSTAAGGIDSAVASGSGLSSAAGMGVIAAIAGYGFSKFKKNYQKKLEANQQYQSLSGSQLEGAGQLNSVSNFVGQLSGSRDSVGEFFITLNEGWMSTLDAMAKANLILESQGALYDENGNQLVKLTGNANAVTDALSRAAVTGHTLKASIAEAGSSSGEARIKIVGDFDTIKTAMEAAGAIGVGSFKNIKQTATGAAVTIQGDLRKWKTYLDGAISMAISSLSNDLNGTVGKANSLTSAFKAAAEAAQSIRVPSRSGRGYARGGSFRVGGSGGNDSRMVSFAASPDETVTVTTPGQRTRDFGGSGNKEILRELRLLRQQEGERVSETIREQGLLQFAGSSR